MLSNFVTAAKGLFTRHESQDERADPAGDSAATTSKMVTTRRGTDAPEDIPEESKNNEVAKGGKRKAPSVNTEKPSSQQTKRRKRSSLEAADASEDESTVDPPKSSNTNADKEQKSARSAPKNHFRFGSEEPAVPEAPHPEETTQAPSNDEEEEDSDDDAPEAIDNSAQLLKMKEQAKRQEKVKQLEDESKREKRRKLDERRKLQAKSTKSKDTSAPNDDLLSESTATLQGSTTQDARRRALPALLPDEILNAEPVARPPTPPAEDDFAARKKPSKLRFLDKTEKAPKDARAGDVTIRVLDAPSAKPNSKPVLAPKASKSGRNVRDTWLKRDKNTARANGLRRTTGGSSGFVRR